MNNPTFGKIFEEARLKMGFSKVQLSRALGVTEASIYRYEKGEVPTPNILKKIEKVMDLEFNVNELKQKPSLFEDINQLLAYLEKEFPVSYRDLRKTTQPSTLEEMFEFLADNNIGAEFGLSNEKSKNYSGTYYVTLRLKKKSDRELLGRKRSDISYYRIYSQREAEIKAILKGFRLLEMIKTGVSYSDV